MLKVNADRGSSEGAELVTAKVAAPSLVERDVNFPMRCLQMLDTSVSFPTKQFEQVEIVSVNRCMQWLARIATVSCRFLDSRQVAFESLRSGIIFMSRLQTTFSFQLFFVFSQSQ